MIPWIMIYTNLLSHPKTGRLVDTLGLNSSSVEPETIAAGMLVSLWTWAAQNAYHGDLSACSDRVIAKACMWKKEPQKLVKALQECGWMDGKVLHDWDEYAELYINQIDNTREKTKERVRRYREKKRNVTPDEPLRYGNGYSNVTCNESNAPTLHNHTEHNNISLLSKERKERKKESPSVTFPPDEELPHVRMLIRCGEQYTREDVETGRQIWLAQQRGENA